MSQNSSLIAAVPQRFAEMIRRPPLDIVLTGGLTALLGVIFAFDLAPGSPLRVMLVVVSIALLPGYLLMAILYPRHGQFERDGFQPTLSQRFALAFGMSIVLLPLCGLLLPLFQLSYTYSAITTVTLFVLVIGTIVAAYRRKTVPEPDRFNLPIPRWTSGIIHWIQSANRRRRLTRALVVVSLLLATASFWYVLAVPQDNEQYTTMSVLSENTEGELVAGGYPTNLTAGEPAEYTLTVTNNREQRASYTVIARLEEVRTENGSTQILRTEQLRQFEASVAVGETWNQTHQLEPSMTGENLRLRYYLYRGSVPDEVTAATAVDHLHLWVDVQRE